MPADSFLLLVRLFDVLLLDCCGRMCVSWDCGVGDGFDAGHDGGLDVRVSVEGFELVLKVAGVFFSNSCHM